MNGEVMLGRIAIVILATFANSVAAESYCLEDPNATNAPMIGSISYAVLDDEQIRFDLHIRREQENRRVMGIELYYGVTRDFEAQSDIDESNYDLHVPVYFSVSREEVYSSIEMKYRFAPFALVVRLGNFDTSVNYCLSQFTITFEQSDIDAKKPLKYLYRHKVMSR